MSATVELPAIASWIRQARRVTVLTGAGISTDSGIPDFRGPNGVWTKDPEAERLSHIRHYMADAEVRALVWKKRLEHPAWEARPNPAHRALADLERKGHLHTLVTQNIDGLHQRAGSRDVVEVHGSIRSSTCPGCGAAYGLDDLLALVEDAEAPACPRCGEIVKPDVVMFGELLPEAAIDRAYELARATRLLLVVGSTLEVWPVSMLPHETVASGGDVAIVNKGPTSFDERAAVRIEGGAGETLAALVERLRR
jgi:NAD-dependent deacetylase